jgi:hypothetical protein
VVKWRAEDTLSVDLNLSNFYQPFVTIVAGSSPVNRTNLTTEDLIMRKTPKKKGTLAYYVKVKPALAAALRGIVA